MSGIPCNVEGAGGPAAEDRRTKMTCEVFGRWDQIEPVAEAWDDLAERTGAGIFSSFAWRRTWWEFYGRHRRLEVRLVREGKRLVAVFPFFRETQRLGILPLRLLRPVGCDHAGPPGAVIVEPGFEVEAVNAFADSLSEEEYSKWDIIQIGPLPGYLEGLERLVRVLLGRFQACCGRTAGCVVVDVPTDGNEYISRLSKKERGGIRRTERRLGEEHDLRHAVKTGLPELAEAFERFLAAHERLWQSKGSIGWFNEWPEAKEFHRRLLAVLAPKGQCFLTELSVDGAVVAGQYGFRFGGVLHALQPVRDPSERWQKYGLGNLAFSYLVNHAVSSGGDLIDRGGAPFEHKLRMGGRLVNHWVMVAGRPDVRSRARVGLFRLGAWVLHTLYQRIWSRRLAPLFGVPRGAFSELWIRSRVPFGAFGDDGPVEPRGVRDGGGEQ